MPEKFTRFILFILCFLVCMTPGVSQQPIYEFDYHIYEESTALLKELASRYSNLAKLYSIGTSVTGMRELWCVEISNQSTGKAEEKPAAYFDGNQHASEVTGGEVTLYLAYYLLTRYGKDPDITRLLDTRVIYIVQRADPDGAEAYMTGETDWDPEKVPGARDADEDGNMGEDGPEDINRDGEILQMRIPDPEGTWKTFGDDPRIMVEREEDETDGTFYRVMSEGIDNDGDGKVNEDPPVTGFISNRNYPAFWSSDDARFRGRGDYPLQEHNSRLVVDFILSRPNISQIESYHTTSGIHLRPYAARPDTDFPPQDLQDYCAILAEGTKITSYPVASVYNDFTTIDPDLPPDKQPGVRHGVFIDWTYQHRGLFSVTTELWTLEPFVNQTGWGDIPREKPLFAIPGRYNRPDVKAAVLKWLDLHKNEEQLSGQGFLEWKRFNHPTLGEVEIGGFTRYWLRNPPPGPFLKKVITDQAKFAVVRALKTPIVKIHNVKAEKSSSNPDMWKITATAANSGYLDTSTEQARIAGLSKADYVKIILPEKASTDDPKKAEFSFMRGTRGSNFVSLYYASWNVDAPEGTEISIRLCSEKGGSDIRKITLTR